MTARGQVTNVSLGNGVTIDREFDQAVGAIRHISAGPNSNPIEQIGYKWGLLGNITQRTLTTNTGKHRHRTTIRQWAFDYDAMSRLTQSQFSKGGRHQKTLTLKYDEIGNIQSKSDQGDYDYDPNHPHEVASIGNDVYTYDDNGNRLTGGGESYTWTAFNKPATIQGTNDDGDTVTTAFAYTPSRARYRQTTTVNSGTTTTTTTLYIGARFKAIITGNTTIYRHQITANGRVVAVYASRTDNVDQTGYLLYDARGSVMAVTGENGHVISRQHYGAFGKRTVDNPDPGDTTALGFGSHEHLLVGLVHMNGRVYDPATAQFTSADPTSGSGLSRYSFVYNNPLTLVDPSGFGVQRLGVISVTGHFPAGFNMNMTISYGSAVVVWEDTHLFWKPLVGAPLPGASFYQRSHSSDADSAESEKAKKNTSGSPTKGNKVDGTVPSSTLTKSKIEFVYKTKGLEKFESAYKDYQNTILSLLKPILPTGPYKINVYLDKTLSPDTAMETPNAHEVRVTPRGLSYKTNVVASEILHELVHVHQWLSKKPRYELPAYQWQQDTGSKFNLPPFYWRFINNKILDLKTKKWEKVPGH